MTGFTAGCSAQVEDAFTSFRCERQHRQPTSGILDIAASAVSQLLIVSEAFGDNFITIWTPGNLAAQQFGGDFPID